ncbi:hypothetical protein ROZALSC1DRAFT_24558, partial [Rozella allomycis CSF55]
KCGPYFNGIGCGQDDIQKFYRYYRYVLDPNETLKNRNNISREDLIGLLVRQKEFTPFNCYNYNYKINQVREPNIKPLEYCAAENIEECVQILMERKFYLESLDVSFGLSHLFNLDMAINIENIRSLVGKKNLSPYEVNEYMETQIQKLQPIDQQLMSYVLSRVKDISNPDATLLHFIKWILRKHINALSYLDFKLFMEELFMDCASPTVVAIIMNEALKTKFELTLREKRNFFRRLLENDSVAAHDPELFMGIVRNFPKDGAMLFKSAFSKLSPKSYGLLKQSGMFVMHRNGRIWISWRDLFYDYLDETDLEMESKQYELLFNSFEDIDKSRIEEVDWVDVFQNQWKSDAIKESLFSKKF